MTEVGNDNMVGRLDLKNMDLLRFTTAGSVDDGKSTLIGRLLYDSKAIFEDQMDHIRAVSERRGDEHVNLALLTDGLRAEREQGITIDVAYRYFATPKRKFIIADTPGHIQYTRNMVTGASTANLAIILVDARQGIIEQTQRHAIIASLLRIPHVVVCINKMDLVDWDQDTFSSIKHHFEEFSSELDIPDAHFIPISALLGDNVVDHSTNMPWYSGPTLLSLLESVDVTEDVNLADTRLPVQYVLRPLASEYHDFRGYAGRMAGGVLHKGDPIVVMPSGLKSTVKSIELYTEQHDTAFAPQSVTVTLHDDIDISRGDMLVSPENLPTVSQDLDVMVCWLGEKELVPGGKYILRHATKEVRCVLKSVSYKLDVNTLHHDDSPSKVAMNDVARVTLRTTAPIAFDPYKRNRTTGSLILIDEASFTTVAAGMIQ
jgi:sulfate adenylyltransferase subunit 1